MGRKKVSSAFQEGEWSDDEAAQSSAEEDKGGFINNLTQDELTALEERKARAAAAVIAAREKAAHERAREAAEQKKQEWRKQKAYVRGSKVCEANRIYEEAGWYICEVCNKKLQDVEWVEQHVATDKHKRNLEWYSAHPVEKWESAASADAAEIPDCVTYDEKEMFYICTLCNAKAACEAVLQAHLGGKEHAKKLANQEWYAQQSVAAVVQAGQLPACVEWLKSEERYICRFCDKRGDSDEQITLHLSSNEHSKKCSNLDIPLYGEPGHLEKVKQHVARYGFDVWARYDEWPDFLVDEATCWKCALCAKKYLTQSAVNDHLKERHPSGAPVGAVSQPRVLRPAPIVETAKRSPPPPPAWNPAVDEAFVCDLCHLPFASKQELSHHERHDLIHQQVVKRLTDNAPPLIEFEDI